MKHLKVDWQELEEAFQDASNDHRYYLDRETGTVHFFSSYLDGEEEEQTERQLTAESRYVSIPVDLRRVPARDLARFIENLDDGRERRILDAVVRREPDPYSRFRETIESLPRAQEKWERFHGEVVRRRLREWLSEVGVQPLE